MTLCFLPEQFAIAIDGPAASGKSTVGRLVANQIDAICFDTGLLYRAVAWAVLEGSVDVRNAEAVTAIANKLDFCIKQEIVDNNSVLKIFVNGTEVTWALQELGADSGLSIVSAYPGVRAALLDMQREIGSTGRVVLLGRDIGTVVLPDADVKIYLEASVEERARRRQLDFLARGEDVSIERVMEQVRLRDELDSTRSVAPLKPADDAVIIDSDGLTPGETAKEIVCLVKHHFTLSGES